MKKQLLTLTLLMFGTLVNAQISKGDLQLGGTFNLSTTETDNGDVNNFSFTPRVGLLLSDNTSLGVILGYSSRKSPVFDIGSGTFLESEVINFSYGVYTRFYKSVSENFYLFLEPAVLLSSGEVDDGATDLSSFSLGVTAGLSYFMGEKFALELTSGNLSYNQIKSTSGGNEVKQDVFNANLSLTNVNLGLTFFLRKN